MRNCTRHPCLSHFFTVHFLGPFHILLSLSPSFPGIKEGTCRFKMADCWTGLAEVFTLPIFCLLFFFATTLLIKASFLSSFSFSSLSTLLSLFLISRHRRRDKRLMWDSEKLYLTSLPCPSFHYPLSWPFPHPSVPLLLSSRHRRRDKQIQSSRQPNRLSRCPYFAHLFSLCCITFISISSYFLPP